MFVVRLWLLTLLPMVCMYLPIYLKEGNVAGFLELYFTDDVTYCR